MGALAFRVAALALGVALWSSQASAQPGHAHGTGASEVLGELSFPNSGNAAAQEPFLRGVKLLHNFQYPQAIEAFQAAQKADPDFALAYWGEAMSYSHALWAEQDLESARKALAKFGATPEARAARTKSARENMWLSTVETLFGSGTKSERDVAYADRMEQFFRAYPDDVEARAFTALATLGRSHGTRDTANYMKAAAMLEEVFPTHMQHPGVVHYLVHAYDDPVHAPLGLRAARLYDKIAPASAHAQHMTSHIFLAMGMWPETEQANVRAGAVVNAMLAARKEPPTACGHGHIWRVYAKLQQGKDVASDVKACRVEAEAKLKGTKDLPVVGAPENSTSSWMDMVVRAGIETGQWSDWPDLPPGKMTFAQFTEDYGRVLASRKSPAAAQAALASLKADRDLLVGNFKKEFPDDDTYLPWIERAVAQGEAVAVLAQGQTDEGLQLLRKAAEAEAALPPPFGPPALQKPSYELLGDELLALGRKEEAAAAYRQALAAAPGRRLSVAGLAAATR